MARPGIDNKPSSFRRRLTVWYVGTMALLLLVFSVQVILIVRAGLYTELEDSLQRDAITVYWAIDGGVELLRTLDETQSVPFFAVYTGGRLAHASIGWQAAALDQSIRGGDTREPYFWTASTGDTFKVLADNRDGGTRVFVARDANEVRLALQSLILTLAIGLPSTLAFAGLGGWLLAGRALRPVRQITRQASEITAERLSQRLRVESPAEEFAELAHVYNETLARLEKSFDQLRRFTADASHQLRTPLAAIRLVGEMGIRDSKSLDDARDVMGSMLEETDRLRNLVDSLLLLTRAEAGQLPVKTEQFNIVELLEELRDSLAVLAEEKDIEVELYGMPVIHVLADRTLLRQVLLNLWDNALKYSPEGGRILITTVRLDGDMVEVVFVDDGPGVPPEERERIFERFHRVDSSANSKTRGTGLGLPLARWLTEAQGGTLNYEPRNCPGSTFIVMVPAAKSQ